MHVARDGAVAGARGAEELPILPVKEEGRVKDSESAGGDANRWLVPTVTGIGVGPSLLGAEYKVNIYPVQLEKRTLQGNAS